MRTHLTTITASAVLLLTAVANTVAAQELNDKERLGELIFIDENLSINRDQSCAVCHQPEVGWTGPDAAINAGGAVYEGSVAGLLATANHPARPTRLPARFSISYADVAVNLSAVTSGTAAPLAKNSATRPPTRHKARS